MKNILIALLFISGSAAAQRTGFYPVRAPQSFGKIELRDSVILTALTASKPMKLDANKNIASAAINVASGSGDITGTLAPANGGTGTATPPSDGQILVANGTVFAPATITYDNTSTLNAAAGALSLTLAGQLNSQTVIDLDATVSGYQTQVRLSGNLTANRVLTFPTFITTRIYTVEVWNRNTTGFTWTISGTVVDAAGNPITTLVNSTYYIFKTTGLGAAWVKVN